MPTIQRYQIFLLELIDSLTDAIGDAENEEWHHLPGSDARAAHLHRLVEWVTMLEARRDYYDNAKAPNLGPGFPRPTEGG